MLMLPSQAFAQQSDDVDAEMRIQQLENHLLQPVIYGRTVQLSPLAVLISILVGAELAGIIGALAAIPVAGSIQVVVNDWLEHRQEHPSTAL